MSRRSIYLAIIALVAFVAFALGGNAHVTSAAAGSISGRVVNDVNQDGVAQADEPGLSGWRVTLEHPGEESRETHTDVNGRFSFSNLSPGDYDVDLSCDGQPSLWGATPGETTGFSFTLDSGANLSDVDFPVVPIAASPSRPHTATITGRVVLDEDRDGDPENSEPGVSGWPLNAYPVDMDTVCFSEPEKQTVTDSEGHFSITGLAPGQYYLNEDQDQQAPLEVWAQYGPGRSISSDAGVEMLSGEPVETRAGRTSEATIGVISLKGTASVSGSIYGDLNKNGSRDPNEPVAKTGVWMALAYRVGDVYVGVSPFLQHYDFGNPPYHFSGLVPGGYFIGALFQLSQAINPPPDTYGVSHTEITLSQGQQLTGVDFGFESIPAGLLSEPTPEPSPTLEPAPQVTPAEPTMSSPTTGGGPGRAGAVNPPNTGSGPSSGRSDRLPDALAVAIGVLGLAALVFAARRRIDVGVRR
jgi:serine-aspartate repeat-containing protein C/D/E